MLTFQRHELGKMEGLCKNIKIKNYIIRNIWVTWRAQEPVSSNASLYYLNLLSADLVGVPTIWECI